VTSAVGFRGLGDSLCKILVSSCVYDSSLIREGERVSKSLKRFLFPGDDLDSLRTLAGALRATRFFTGCWIPMIVLLRVF